MKILVICGAGASSTFVAHRMRAAIADRGLDIDVAAASDTDLASSLSAVDVLLVGPHLAPRFDDIRALAAATGVRARLLPADLFPVRNGDRALDLALDAARS